MIRLIQGLWVNWDFLQVNIQNGKDHVHYCSDELRDQIQAVLSDEEIEPMELVEVYVSSILDMKITSNLIK